MSARIIEIPIIILARNIEIPIMLARIIEITII